MKFNSFDPNNKNNYYELRNPKTKAHLGYKGRTNANSNELYVLNNGAVDYFVEEYQALRNFDMGQAVEVVDMKTGKVDHFALIYSFKHEETDIFYHCYKVLETTLTNLDILEIINFHKEKNK